MHIYIYIIYVYMYANIYIYRDLIDYDFINKYSQYLKNNFNLSSVDETNKYLRSIYSCKV